MLLKCFIRFIKKKLIYEILEQTKPQTLKVRGFS
ncbi:MAG: hypothetical protein ACI81G_001047 [Gammaproteobacteria bacterium]